MKPTQKQVLTKVHVLFLVQNCLIGTGILQLPQSLSSMGYNQAFMPIFFAIIATLTLWPMVWLNSKFPNEDFFQINKILLGKVLGTFCNITFIVKFTFLCASTISSYMLLIQSTALPEQTLTFPVICFLILLIYLVKGGIFNIARFCVIAFFIGLPMLFFTQWAIEKGEFSHIFPLFNFTLPELYDATRNGYLSFLGYELILFYYPYIIHKKSAYKYATIGIWISALIMLITTVVSVMYFSEWQLKNVEFSVLNIFKAGEYSFIERIDIICMTLWILFVYSTVALYLWAANEGFKKMIWSKSSIHLYLLVFGIFLLLILPISQHTKVKFYSLIDHAVYLMIIWPIFLLIVYFFRKKQVQQ
ncbi:GerAB/ArcD/ProY family transporter [Metasolibacillus meyeri]|uniref:GerAB/ArcD/ProY family transporter n=1 Tax=Metasolibacillus meyeri TaxID=1071052 RepID=A0AAW9NJV3_9BACL|nr:GerAB/ArcD/ProY family transporter [Metasolibacillus meyeri]MEC1178969.1 GerAB/ArcD/ProY family transporter [Metasolibacillus meyeri]